VHLAVLEGGHHGAIQAALVAVLEHFIAVLTNAGAKVFSEATIRLDKLEIAIHDRDVAWDLLEEQEKLFVGFVECVFEVLLFGNVSGQFHDRRDFIILVPDRLGQGDHVQTPAVSALDRTFIPAGLAVQKGLLHRAPLALFFLALAELVAIPAMVIAECITEVAVRLDHLEVFVEHRDEARNVLEQGVVELAAFNQLRLEFLDLGDVGGHLHDGNDFAVVVMNRGRVDAISLER